MRRRGQILERRPSLVASIGSACLVGIFLFVTRLGDPPARVSYDAPFLFGPPPAMTDVVIVTMNESTYDDPELNSNYSYPDFDRSTHARFLEKLTADGARLVVFDIFFEKEMDEDAALTAAIREHGRVILAGELEPLAEEEFAGFQPKDPAEAFVELPGSQIALAEVDPDAGVVRRFPIEREIAPSIPLAAALADGVKVDALAKAEKWVGYYGDRDTLPTETYQSAFRRAPGYFRDKAVFIGGKPKTDFLLGRSDEFNTALTRWTRNPMRGVEIHATMYLNLVRREWLTRISPGWELLIILAAGGTFGWLASRFSPTRGALVTIGSAVVLSVAAVFIFWMFRVWMNWVLVAWVQLPTAWAAAALVYSRKVEQAKETLEEELETIRSNLPAAPADRSAISSPGILDDIQPVEGNGSSVRIPSYDLLRVIGEGAYGQVWLAQSLIGGFRAIKIVFRTEDRPFEREFEGVRNFGEISRMHPGWVTIFHVGKDESAGFFYYVMETADDLALGRTIDPGRYVPKTLGKLLVERQWLPVTDCVEIGIRLADAVAALHRLELVHRDLKPSNIIFVNGSPKLADIGLVARAGVHKSEAGTLNFIPNEGMGTIQADIFSLGRVLYQISTGSDPSYYPGLPPSVNKRKDARELMQLMEIINTACAPFHGNRYQSAPEMRGELEALQRRLQKRLK